MPAADIEHPEVRELAREAQAFVESFSWCERVTACRLAFAIAGVVGIFRVDFVAAGAGADPTVWVVVGDLPPAYLGFEEGDSWQDALAGYVDEMQGWVDAVRTGGSFDEVIPVDAPRTAANADALASRLGFLRTRLLKRTYPTGEVRELTIPAPQYKELARATMPLAKARGDLSTYTNVRYAVEGEGVRIRAKRFSELKKYDSPLSLLVKPSASGSWLIQEELSESRP